MRGIGFPIWRMLSAVGLLAAAGLIVVSYGAIVGQEQPSYHLDALPAYGTDSSSRDVLSRVQHFWIAQAKDSKQADRIARELEKELSWERTTDPGQADVVIFEGTQGYTYGNHPAQFPTDPSGGQAAMPTKRYLHIFAVLTNTHPPMVLHRYERRNLSDRPVTGEAVKELRAFLEQ